MTISSIIISAFVAVVSTVIINVIVDVRNVIFIFWHVADAVIVIVIVVQFKLQWYLQYELYVLPSHYRISDVS